MRRTFAHILLAILALPLLAGAGYGWSFAVGGDSRNDEHGILPRILAEVDRSPMEFFIHTGDLENGGGDARWTAFMTRTKGFRKPIHYVLGNHEVHRGGTRESFARFFGLGDVNHSFDHKDAHVAIVDTVTASRLEGTLDWLDRDLSAHPKGKAGIRHLIVAMHVPPRTDNIFPHGTAAGYDVFSRKLHALLKRHGVRLVLCSHEHIHQVDDWGGIKVIVSGGAGAPMIPFQDYGYYEIDLSGDTPRETFHVITP
jgi:3',5'-cyclic AMP phosphodiesterase CpdA